MRFDVYGRFQLELSWETDRWVAYRLAPGKRMPFRGLAVPGDIQTPGEIARYLDDLYHEVARPGQSVREITD